MNAVDLLIGQHRALEAQLEALVGAGEPERRALLLGVAGDHLTVHLASEEQVFYPAVRARRTEDILLESLEEHLSLKRLLADLLELDPAAATFLPKTKVLCEQAAHHHEEEEGHLFPKARQLLDEVHLDDLGRTMLALQEKLRAVGHPRASVAAETEAAARLE